ncbi:MAG: hypothetical protein QXM56_00390 [Acidilobaceae archaeon]
MRKARGMYGTVKRTLLKMLLSDRYEREILLISVLIAMWVGLGVLLPLLPELYIGTEEFKVSSKFIISMLLSIVTIEILS